MKQRVLIRTDASIRIGSGHVARMKTLARVLLAQGDEVLFLVRDRPGVEALFSGADAALAVLLPSLPDAAAGTAPDPQAQPPHASWLGTDWERDLEDCRQVLARRGAMQWDWLVVDHYALDARWHRAARAFATQVLVMDDLADRPLAADLVLDQNLGRQASDYHGLVDTETRLLMGPEYALLRPDFAQQAGHSPTEPVSEQAPHIVVSLGGSDPEGIGPALVELIAAEAVRRGLQLRLTHVTGLLAPGARKAVASEQRQGVLLRRIRHVERYADLLRAADLVIGAAGGSAWERCALGCVSALVVLAANQSPGAHALCAAEAAESLLALGESPTHATASRTLDLLEDSARCAALAARALSLCDGQGTQRVVRAMQRCGAAQHRDESLL